MSDKIQIMIDGWIQQGKTGKIVINPTSDTITITFHESLNNVPQDKISELVKMGKNIQIGTYGGGIRSITLTEQYRIPCHKTNRTA